MFSLVFSLPHFIVDFIWMGSGFYCFSDTFLLVLMGFSWNFIMYILNALAASVALARTKAGYNFCKWINNNWRRGVGSCSLQLLNCALIRSFFKSLHYHRMSGSVWAVPNKFQIQLHFHSLRQTVLSGFIQEQMGNGIILLNQSLGQAFELLWALRQVAFSAIKGICFKKTKWFLLVLVFSGGLAFRLMLCMTCKW